jgi:hypothetical protein
MVYWVNYRSPVIKARFEFKPEHAHHFVSDDFGQQTIVEMAFESVEALIMMVQGLEHVLVDCTAIVNGNVVNLRSLSVK